MAGRPPGPVATGEERRVLEVTGTDEGVVARTVERRLPGRLYGRTASQIAGPLQPTEPVARYREGLSRRQKAAMVLAGAAHIGTSLALLGYVLWPSHPPLLEG